MVGSFLVSFRRSVLPSWFSLEVGQRENIYYELSMIPVVDPLEDH